MFESLDFNRIYESQGQSRTGKKNTYMAYVLIPVTL